MSDQHPLIERIQRDRERREAGAQICRDAADLIESGLMPYDEIGKAMAALFRQTAWMGDLDTVNLARVPCDEILTLAAAVLATPSARTEPTSKETL